MQEVFLFCLALIAPVTYWRLFFFFNPRYFEKPFLRTYSGLSIHHSHHGILLIIISSILLLFNGRTVLQIILLGLGLGLVFDELIDQLKTPGNRSEELALYNRTSRPTFILIGLVIAVIITVALLK